MPIKSMVKLLPTGIGHRAPGTYSQYSIVAFHYDWNTQVETR